MADDEKATPEGEEVTTMKDDLRATATKKSDKDEPKFGDLDNESKKNIVSEQREMTLSARKEERVKQERKMKTSDLKDLSASDVYIEMGDGKPATIGHLNVLARRLARLEGVDEDTELRRFDEMIPEAAVKLSKSAVLEPAPAAEQ